jgi:Thioesterase domain
MADGIGRIVTTPHLAKIEPGSLTEITVWARMEPREGIASGDAYFMTSDGQLLGFMQDVVFKQLKRTALERLVSMSAAQMATKASKFLDAPAVKKKSHLSDSALIMPSPSETSSDYSADWVHLAGPTFNAAAGQQPIFLLPDGSGSVGCFAQFLPKSWNVPVLGLNSPFAREGKDKNWTGGISQLAACFFEIIVRIQREGPYVIAGYSLGAMCAVEVARLLAGAGKLVDHLILLECPALNKRNLPPLPPGSLDVLLAKVESAAARRHFERASIAVPGHSFSFDWPEPNQVLVINAADDSLTPNLMTSRPEDWKAVFKLAELKLRVAKGNHQTFLREALKILAQTLA